ncbi:muconolactone Delta-isomerase family protein [Spongiactinospora rosea]|uniref:muconolactone Delta-isomerase family protein n=1 Tax=Spongiactinospora rosea TaxID=2248750 RepID=UPI0018F35FBB
MDFLVRVDGARAYEFPAVESAALIEREKARGRELMAAGTIRHFWRILGRPRQHRHLAGRRRRRPACRSGRTPTSRSPRRPATWRPRHPEPAYPPWRASRRPGRWRYPAFRPIELRRSKSTPNRTPDARDHGRAAAGTGLRRMDSRPAPQAPVRTRAAGSRPPRSPARPAESEGRAEPTPGRLPLRDRRRAAAPGEWRPGPDTSAQP